MRLTTVLILAVTLHVSATTFAQKITYVQKDATLIQLFKEIKKQAGYNVVWNEDKLDVSKKINANFQNAELAEVMDKGLNGLPFTYTITKKTIVIKEKTHNLLDRILDRFTDIDLHGTIFDDQGMPLPGATIKIKQGRAVVLSDSQGAFTINTTLPEGVLIISYTGYKTVEIPFGKNTTGSFTITLYQDESRLKEVEIVSTGYQDIPKERITGSFVKIDSTLINRKVSSGILDRLEGVTSSLYFNGARVERTLPYGGSVLGINIRGQSTLSADVSRDPLIILDKFPYEGNIDNINPNDIASITVLKDAAAASIWGARSGNGVIVITTKKGRTNQKPIVEFNSSVNIGNKPDLFKDRKFLKATDYIDIEEYLYAKGYFNTDIGNTTTRPALSPVIDILASSLSQTEKDAKIDALRNLDYRSDYQKYFYQKEINQQYSLGIRGGGNNMAYAFSAGIDNDRDKMVNNGYDRTSLNAQNTYMPVKNLNITTFLNYTKSKALRNNQLGYGLVTIGGKYGKLYPYAQLAGDDGNALPIVKDYRENYVNGTAALGFLDWRYRPLDEISNADAYDNIQSILARISINYKFTSFLNAEALYQNESQATDTYDYFNTNAYYTRNLINKYSQYDEAANVFTYPFPNGGILDLGNYDRRSNNGRLQLNFDKAINIDHQITAIAGAEIREVKTQSNGHISNGYDDEYGTAVTKINYDTRYPTNPSGSSTISAPPGLVNGQTYRYISYYLNGAYTYKNLYSATISGRKDGSNIFGAKTNNKITPLWSAGLAYTISNENFYNINWLTSLKLRASYGFNGNVYNGSAYTTGVYSTSADLTRAQIITSLTAPNPELRWEKVKNVNLGVDFVLKGNRITGSLELWQKKGFDLINPIPLAPSTGFSSFNGNSASTRTKGIDLQLNTSNLQGKFRWNTVLLTNILNDKVLSYNVTQYSSSIQVYGGIALPGKPLYSVFSYKWAGLDPIYGDPQGYLNGKISKDYLAIINNFNPDSLVFHGSARPKLFGSIRNEFGYKAFSISVNIVYKAGYYFRRPSTSINYSEIIGQTGYSDVAQRWQQPGDEKITTVPSLAYPSNPNRNNFYQYSSGSVEKADHVRLQDVRLSYTLTKMVWKALPFRSCQVYTYANNLGIIWRANHHGIDPDAVGSNQTFVLPLPFSIAFGLNINL